MSVQTEIDRLNEAKAAIIAAIAAKGVVVVEGEKLDAMADKIAQIVTGVVLPELGDTAAQPGDMAKDKVLYDDEGNPVTGTLSVCGPQVYFEVEDDVVCSAAPDYPTLAAMGVYKQSYSGTDQDSLIVKPGATVILRNIPITKLGDAKPEDVAYGKTFTSANGALLEGTHECNAGGDTGSAMQFATGTFTPALDICTNPVTVSGLNFEPKSLVVTLFGAGYMPARKSSLVSLATGELFDDFALQVTTGTATSMKQANEAYVVEFTQDGFILKSTDTADGATGYKYVYYAFG